MENQTLHTEEVNAKGAAVKNGIIWAIIGIVIFLLTYYALPSMMVTVSYAIISFLISIGLAIFFTLDLRKKVGGYWSFREALGPIFLMFVVQVVITTCFSTAFAKWIEPGYGDFIREATLNSTTELFQNMSTDQEMIDKQIADTEERLEKSLNPTLLEFLQGLAIAIIIYFVGALIFAAIFKRSRPEFMAVRDEEV